MIERRAQAGCRAHESDTYAAESKFEHDVVVQRPPQALRLIETRAEPRRVDIGRRDQHRRHSRALASQGYHGLAGLGLGEEAIRCQAQGLTGSSWATFATCRSRWPVRL